jgi:hypothetical protein
MVNFTGSERKVPQSVAKHMQKFLIKNYSTFFCSSKFLDEKNCNRKEVEIDKEGRESSRSFFTKFGRNLIIFAAF